MIDNELVLIIEDDWQFADSLVSSLKNALQKVRFIIADNSESAMSEINQQVPDLILADLHLGNQNFLTLLNELASYPDTLKIPKIILSSSGAALKLADLEKYGIKSIYDKKTYLFQDLVVTIEGLISRAS